MSRASFYTMHVRNPVRFLGGGGGGRGTGIHILCKISVLLPVLIFLAPHTMILKPPFEILKDTWFVSD
jgi:hypothetical protein